MPWRGEPAWKALRAFRVFPLILWSVVSLALASPLFAASQSPAGGAPAGTTQAPKQTIRAVGSVTTTYRLEAAAGEMDHRLSETALLDVLLFPSGLVRVHVSADGRAVLGSDQTYPLVDLADAWPGQISGSLYEAYVEISGMVPFLPELRVGRQVSPRSDPFYFDGLSAVLSLGDMLSLTAYGGVGVHFYELDWTWGSDFTAGAGLDFHPLPFTRLSADYAYVRDSRISFLGESQSNSLLSFRAWQDLFSALKLTAELRMINLAPEDVRVGIMGNFPSIGLQGTLSWYGQFVPLAELSNELSGYYDVVGETLPYQTAEISLSERLGSHFGIRVGGLTRLLLYGAEESEFNREYWKVSIGLDLIDILIRGLTVSVPGEIWLTDDSQHYATGIGISYRGSPGANGLLLEAGSYFSLFKYDNFALEGERSDTQTVYARARIPLGSAFSIQARYELELGTTVFHTLYIGARGDF